MLRVLIERPSVGTGDLNSAQKQFRAAARQYPDVARKLKVEFCGSDEERETKLAKAEVFVAWRFPTGDLARRGPQLKWIQLTGAGVAPIAWPSGPSRSGACMTCCPRPTFSS